MRATSSIVIGGGAAGLSAALALRDAGIEATLLEAGTEPGGKAGTLREAGFLLERGPIGVLDRDGELEPLCRRLGLRLVPARAEARERWVVREGRLHALPASLPALLATRLFTFREKLLLAGEPFRRARPPGGPPESVAAFFARRLGGGGSFLASALQSGIYAGDPNRLELASAFPALARFEAAHGGLLRGARAEGAARARARRAAGLPRAVRLSSFEGGMSELPAALARALGPAVRTEARATEVHREGAGFRVELLERGKPATLRAEALVLAVPAQQAASLLRFVDGALAARLSELRAAPISLVHVGVAAGALPRPLRGFGVLAPGRPVVGTLFPSCLWEGRAPPGAALLSSLVGGALHPEAAALPDGALVALVRAHLAEVVGLPAAAPALLTRVVRWPEAIPQYDLGHAARVAEIDAHVAGHAGLALAGASLHGVSVLDCLRDGARAARAAAGLA